MTPAQPVWTRAHLRELVTGVQPVCSVYLGIQPTDTSIDFATDLGKRWHAHAIELAEHGADETTRDAIAEHLGWLEPGLTELALFGAEGTVRAAQALPGEQPFDLARWGAPACVVPVLAWLQRHPAYVLVLVDRTGADITTVPEGAIGGATTTVQGPDDQVELVKAGGWSNPRFQRRAGDSWKHNAEAAAAATAQAADEVGARLLLVGGDVRTAKMLVDHLPDALVRRAPVRPVSGGSRGFDGSEPVRREMITNTLDEYAAATNRVLLERFEAGGGGDGTTAAGPEKTLAALLAGRVETLFVPPGAADERTAWFGPDLLCVARREDAPHGTDTGLREGRMVDVAVRAALLTDARIRVLDATQAAGLPGGIGALCRYR